MEMIAALFMFSLYKATEKIWEKGFDAAWGPVDEALKARFTRWAGKGKEAERKAAFEKAARVARASTLRIAADPQQAARILDALDGERDRRGAQALAEEATKLMLFSAAPDVPRLAKICRHTLSFDALYASETPPPPETVAAVLSDFLTDLREALLDQKPYHDLIEKDMRRALNEILAELRPIPYDDEATYRHQMAAMYRHLLTLARNTQVDAEVRNDAYNSLKRLVGGATADGE